MAHNIQRDRGFNKQSHVGEFPFRYLSTDLHNSGHKRMAQIKLGLWICDILGISSTVLGFLTNIDNIKSAILFILGAIYLSARAYFYIRLKDIQVRKELWEQKQRETNKPQ
jgi:hypothetical protein